MKNKTYRIINYVIAACHLLLVAVCYSSLPAKIAMNWSMDGTASYSNKAELFAMCGMTVFFAFLFDFLPRIDPRRKNYEKFGSYYDGFCIFMQIFMLLMTGIVLNEAYRPGTISVPMVCMLMVGVLFLYIGNMMPKVKSNFYMGIKTPWALSSEEVWRKTHRLGGKCFFVCGILMIGCAFVPNLKVSFWLTMICVFVIAMIPSIMSYIWWRREQNTLS